MGRDRPGAELLRNTIFGRQLSWDARDAARECRDAGKCCNCRALARSLGWLCWHGLPPVTAPGPEAKGCLCCREFLFPGAQQQS